MRNKDRSVPIFLDRDNSNLSNYNKFLRFNYFYIELVEPHPVTISNEHISFPVLLVDLEGVLLSKLGEQDGLFIDPQDITNLLDYINNETQYAVNVGYFWIPSSVLIPLENRTIYRRDVLRIHEYLFIQALKNFHTPENISFDVDNLSEMIYLSEEESIAFKKWGQQTLKRIKDRYHTSKKNNLRERNLNK